MDHVNAMDALLGRLHGVLTTAGGAGTEPASASSADGLVSVTLAPDGRVTTIDADPRVLRRPAPELAASITEAVNAALDELAARAADGPDLMSGLRDVQEDTVRLMRQTTGEYAASVERMEDLHR